MMRNFLTLDQFSVDESTGIVLLSSQQASEMQPTIALRQEGDYLAISTSYGALEIALRPRLNELTHALAHLTPSDGMQTTRTIGSSESHIAVGLRTDGSLNLRPILIQDATGFLALNFRLSSEVRKSLYEWMNVTSK